MELLARIISTFATVVCLSTASTSFAGIINGDFEAGNFDGWTVQNNDGCCGGTPLVTLFDTNNDGISNFAATFDVGLLGATISQTVFLNAGSLIFSANLASWSNSMNADGGTFKVFFDGLLLNQYDFSTNPLTTLYRSLNFSLANINAGNHALQIGITRQYGASWGNTPFEYIDDISISGTSVLAVPEPSTITLLTVSCLMFFRRKKKNNDLLNCSNRDPI